MSDGWKENADYRITQEIRDQLDEESPFMTGWVLVAQFVDSEGEVSIAFNSMPDQKRTTDLGLLQHAMTVSQANIFWDERPNGD